MGVALLAVSMTGCSASSPARSGTGSTSSGPPTGSSGPSSGSRSGSSPGPSSSSSSSTTSGAGSATTAAPSSSTSTTGPKAKASAAKGSTPSGTALLALAGQQLLAEPVHLQLTETATYAPFRLTGSEAADPIDHETSLSLELVEGGITVSSRVIQIGSRVWAESTPPGGDWREESVRPTSPFPLLGLVPYLVDVHRIPGKVIDGHPTVGEAATLDAAGVAFLVRAIIGDSSLPGAQTIRGLSFDTWVGPAHHVREIAETEMITQGGQPAEIFDTTYYDHWGQGIDLTPPAVAT